MTDEDDLSRPRTHPYLRKGLGESSRGLSHCRRDRYDRNFHQPLAPEKGMAAFFMSN